MPEDKPETEIEDLGAQPVPTDDEETSDEAPEIEETDKDEPDEDESEATEEESEDADPPEKPEKSDKPAEKRIRELTARLKQAQEDLEGERERVADLEKEISTTTDKAYAKHTLTYHQVNVLDMTEREFRRVIIDVDRRTDIDDTEKSRRIDLMETAREKHAKELAEATGKVRAQLAEKGTKLWNQEWQIVEKEVLAMNPELSKHTNRINEYMQEEFKTRPALVERLKRGPLQKFRYALEVMEELKINHELEAEAYANNRPAPGASAGKGKATTANSKSKTPSFTRAQIDKMSQAEYERREPEIEKAMKAGRIR